MLVGTSTPSGACSRSGRELQLLALSFVAHVNKINLPSGSDSCSVTLAKPPSAHEDGTSPRLFPVPFISAFSRRREWHEAALSGSSNYTTCSPNGLFPRG